MNGNTKNSSRNGMFGVSLTASSVFFENGSDFDTHSRANSNSYTTGSNTNACFPRVAHGQSVYSHKNSSADWIAAANPSAASWHSVQNHDSANTDPIARNLLGSIDADPHIGSDFGSFDFNRQNSRIQHEQRQLELELLLLREHERERERERDHELMMQYRQQINQEKYQHQQQRQQQQHQYIETSLDQDLYGIYSATTRKMSIDASIDIPSPANSFYSAPNSRNSSIDMETTVFNVGLLDHRRQFDTKESLYTEPSPPPQQSIIEVTRSAVSNSNIQSLQSTGGGTAAITPDFAAALTVAQCALSQRKKQKDSVPPVGYCCRLCAIEGHWMENCILYISNKYPQYNNAARAVALNIISPNSQVVLNTLPIVQQPQHQYTPKFYAEQMKQELEHQHYLQQRQQQQKYYYSDTTPNSLTSLSPDNVSRFAQIWDN